MQRFVDDDDGYEEWLAGHPTGFVLNVERSPRAANIMLHRAVCYTISGSPARGTQWTRDYIKLCGERKTLERIAYTLKTGKPLRN